MPTGGSVYSSEQGWDEDSESGLAEVLVEQQQPPPPHRCISQSDVDVDFGANDLYGGGRADSWTAPLFICGLTMLGALGGAALTGCTLAGLAIVAAYYLGMLVGKNVLAYRVQNWGSTSHTLGWLRYFVGVGNLSFLSIFKAFLLLPTLLGKDRSLLATLVLYAVTALWECSNGVLVLGGSTLLKQCRIGSYQCALVAACAPCQVAFLPAGDRDAFGRPGPKAWQLSF